MLTQVLKSVGMNKNFLKISIGFTLFGITILTQLQMTTHAADLMMKAARFEPGGPANLKIADITRPRLRQNEILLKVMTTAINRADTLQRKGLYPAPAGESDILGLEAAGVVSQLGPGCSKKWAVGDRVMALLPGGGNAEYVAVHEGHVMPVSGDLTMTQAASIPEVWLTAFQLLHLVGQMRKGYTVLIHAGGSGVGTAAVQLVKLAGGTSYVTAGSQDKIDTAMNLGATDGFNYKEGNFSDWILAATNGKGVNLILDCVGSSYWEKNVNSLAVDGTWVLYGLLGGGNVDGPILSKLLRKRATLVASTLRARSKEYKTELVEEFSRRALPYFQTGDLQTVIYKVFPTLAYLAEAHEMMEANVNVGKIVLVVGDDTKDEL